MDTPNTAPLRHHLRPRMVVLGCVVLAGIALAATTYRWFTNPLNVLARREADVLSEIRETKRNIEATELELKALTDSYALLQQRRDEINAAKIAEANKGVTDTRPIKVPEAQAFPAPKNQ